MSPGPGGRAGFALPAVLVVVGVLALTFLSALGALESLNAQTRQVMAEARLQRAAQDLEAQIAYIAATRPLGPATIGLPTLTAEDGFGGPGRGQLPVRIDGQPYRLADTPGLVVSIQDEAGLINLGGLSRPAVERLFAAHGAPAAALTDRFLDFIDPDDLRRAGGAEEDDYRRAGLAPPPNRPLRRVAELWGLLGLREAVTPEARAELVETLVADPLLVQLNVNTASPQALKILFGLDDVQAAAAVSRRNLAPFRSVEDLGRATGVAMVGDAERGDAFPAGRFAVKLVDPAVGLVARSRIVMTPRDAERPAWFEERGVLSLAAGRRAPSPADAPVLPDPTR